MTTHTHTDTHTTKLHKADQADLCDLHSKPNALPTPAFCRTRKAKGTREFTAAGRGTVDLSSSSLKRTGVITRRVILSLDQSRGDGLSAVISGAVNVHRQTRDNGNYCADRTEIATQFYSFMVTTTIFLSRSTQVPSLIHRHSNKCQQC